MTKSILTVSAWKLFIGFVVGMVAAQIIALVVATHFGWNPEYGPSPTLKYALMTHLRILLVVVMAIITNTLSVYFTEVYGVVSAVIGITVVANIFCLIAVISFPARELKSIELMRTARFWEFWRELMLFLLWPVSVWWLQPRLTTIETTESGQKD